MSVIQILALLIIASICGSVGAGIAGASKKGCLGSIALGFIGSMIGHYIAVRFGLPMLFTIKIGNQPFPIFWSIIGAAIFVAILGLFSGRKKD